jgi:hypothetical protein
MLNNQTKTVMEKEFTVYYYDGSYQFVSHVVEGTTVNNLYAGVINYLKEAQQHRPSYVGGYWAIVKDQDGEGVCRVKHNEDTNEYQVGIIYNNELEWYKPSLINPGYELAILQRV